MTCLRLENPFLGVEVTEKFIFRAVTSRDILYICAIIFGLFVTELRCGLTLSHAGTAARYKNSSLSGVAADSRICVSQARDPGRHPGHLCHTYDRWQNRVVFLFCFSSSIKACCKHLLNDNQTKQKYVLLPLLGQ